MSDWHLFAPFWKSETVFGESLFFLREGENAPDAPLLFAPAEVVEVRSSSGEEVYVEGKDFRVEGRRLVLCEGSRMAWMDSRELFRREGQEQVIDHRKGEPEVKLLFGEGHFFHDLQAQVTYRRSGEWGGYVPEFQGERLPRTTGRLARGEGLRICMSGDSISAGANASKRTGVAPHMPPYGELVAAGLEERCAAAVEFANFAVGGKGVAHGVEVAAEAAGRKPDLMVIAYGMNDVGRRDAEGFRRQIAEGMEIVRRSSPETEFLLVATMLGNPEWAHTPEEVFPEYREGLASLCGEGVALADMTRMWADMLRCKRYHDLTGNGVNHPNDFGHRVYAQVILSLLVE